MKLVCNLKHHAVQEVETLTNVGNKTQRQRNKPTSEGKKSGGGEGNNGSASSLELEWEDDKVQTSVRPRKSSSKVLTGELEVCVS